MAPNLPKSYKQAAFKEQGGPLVLEEVELTLPSKGEVLIKVEACGVCGSDHAAQNNAMGLGFPAVPGHEIIGNVVAVGQDEQRWKEGDRVGGGWHGGHDGTCKACKKGIFQCCENEQINGVTKKGGYAQYCLLRSEAAVPIPTDVKATEYAPILCAGVTVFNAMRQMKVAPGSLVAIQGLGGLGHLAVQYARKSGFRVAALSRDGTKEKFARDLGAHEYIDGSKGDQGEQLQKLGGAAMIVATAPSPTAIQPLMKGLDTMGKLLIVAIAGEVTIDTMSMIVKGLSVVAWPSGHAMDSEEALDFTRLQDVKCMVEEFPLEKCNDAFDAMTKGSVRFRAVLKMD